MGPFPTWIRDVPKVDIPFTGFAGRFLESPHDPAVFYRVSPSFATDLKARTPRATRCSCGSWRNGRR